MDTARTRSECEGEFTEDLDAFLAEACVGGLGGGANAFTVAIARDTLKITRTSAFSRHPAAGRRPWRAASEFVQCCGAEPTA